MSSRLLATVVACLSFYLVTQGTGAFAQDESATPAATPATTATPPAAPAATAPAETPAAAPAELAQAPAPAQSPTPEAAPAEAPSVPAPTQTPAPTATVPPAPSPTATPGAIGEDLSRPRGKRKPAERKVADCNGKGELAAGAADGPVTSGSSLGRECIDRPGSHDKAETPDVTPAAPAAPVTRGDGTPTPANPTFTLAEPGPARIGVPNFFIEKFRIPPFLLPIYQAAGMQYGIRWEVLAAINEIETDYGRNLNISSAGALGWMQFMPATWDAYGVDANGDGQKDPFNPVDAIFAAARYLRAAGAEKDLPRAIFAYNHADWYVDSVLMRARVIGGLPSDLVGSLTGLTQGRFPVGARATYAGEVRTGRKVRQGENAAHVVASDGARKAIRVFSRPGAPVLATNDGRIVRMGTSNTRGNYIVLQDPYGNTFTYSGLAKLAKTYPFPKPRKARRAEIRRELALTKTDAEPTAPASAATRAELRARRSRTVKPRKRTHAVPANERLAASGAALPAAVPSKERLFAHPARPRARAAGGDEQLALVNADPMVLDGRRLDPRHFVPKPLERGARVVAGTVLGRIGKTAPELAPHVRFEIRPAGRGAPRIDPKPILDGWKLLESTAIYRAKKQNPFFGTDAEQPSIGQIMLMSKAALQRHVLANPRIQLYECGRQDVRTGQVDRRVLAMLEYLAASGLKPTVTSLRCGHGFYTASGNVSHHSSGNAVDIAAVNGIVISPSTQGKGSITDITIQRLLTLQGTMKPQQIISLMTFDGADNTFAMGDHHDHIHVGFRPLYDADSKEARRVAAVLEPDQWIKLIDRLSDIDNPVVREQPSKFSVKVVRRASRAHTAD